MSDTRTTIAALEDIEGTYKEAERLIKELKHFDFKEGYPSVYERQLKSLVGSLRKDAERLEKAIK